MGFRKYKGKDLNYIDLQYATVFGGIGTGYVSIKDKSDNMKKTKGFRLKAWGGLFLNASYDYLLQFSGRNSHNFGLILVTPIPSDGFDIGTGN